MVSPSMVSAVSGQGVGIFSGVSVVAMVSGSAGRTVSRSDGQQVATCGDVVAIVSRSATSRPRCGPRDGGDVVAIASPFSASPWVTWCPVAGCRRSFHVTRWRTGIYTKVSRMGHFRVEISAAVLNGLTISTKVDFQRPKFLRKNKANVQKLTNKIISELR